MFYLLNKKKFINLNKLKNNINLTMIQKFKNF